MSKVKDVIDDVINCDCEIKPFEYLKGTIIAIFITKKGIEYQVRYYMNGEQKTDYFFDWEIILLGDK
jgi:hypothetical protein